MIYARMEEMSFRTGSAAVAGVLAVAATAVLLTLTQGGHHAAAPRVQAGLAPSPLVAAPAIMPLSPSATHHAHTHRPPAVSNVGYVPAKTPTARPHAAPAPSSPLPMRTFWTRPPVLRGRPSPAPTIPRSWPTPSYPFNLPA
jgi:hypothetical protein